MISKYVKFQRLYSRYIKNNLFLFDSKTTNVYLCAFQSIIIVL